MLLAVQSVRISPARVAGILSLIVATLVTIHLVAYWYQSGILDGGFPRMVLRRFNLIRENTVPTYFSSVLLLSVSVVLSSIALDLRGNRFERHWTILAIIFLLLSVDEASSFHEMFLQPVRSTINVDGWLHFAWVVPALVFVLLFTLSYFRFFLHLPPRFQKLFALSGLLYVGSALGLEMVAGQVTSAYGLGDTLGYFLLETTEETLEMVGMVLFLYTLLTYKALFGRDVHLQIAQSGNPSQDPPHPTDGRA